MFNHSKAKSSSRRKFQYGFLSTAAILATAQFASADNFTWTGANGTFWDLSAINWTNSVPAASAWINPGTATFALATPTAVVLQNDNIQVTAITFTTTGWNISSSGGTGVLQYGSTGTIAISSPGLNTISGVIADMSPPAA